jgi:hypothetical protein
MDIKSSERIRKREERERERKLPHCSINTWRTVFPSVQMKNGKNSTIYFGINEFIGIP